MNGFKSKAMMAGILAAGLAGASGCHDYCYDDLVDPCWPQRYNCMARAAVTPSFVHQANNGLALEQTVWNYHFVTDQEGKPTAILNPMGQAHLAYLARRRPSPCLDLFVQTAHEITYDAAKPEALLQARSELDHQRIKAITDYMSAARPDVPFRVAVHDPHPVYLHGIEVGNAVRNMHGTSQGNMPSESFGDQVPIHGIRGDGANPTGTGAAGVAAAGASNVTINSPPSGVSGAAGPAAQPGGPAGPAAGGQP